MILFVGTLECRRTRGRWAVGFDGDKVHFGRDLVDHTHELFGE